MSTYMQYAPYKLKGDWESKEKRLGRRSCRRSAQYAPNLPELNSDAPDHYAAWIWKKNMD